MDIFTTIADCRKGSARTCIVMWLALSTLALLALRIAVISCLFFEGIVLAVCVFTYIYVCKNTARWKLEFQGNTLLVTNLGNQQKYRVYDVLAEDFILKQTKFQLKRDCGDLRVKDTVVMMGDVQQFSAVKQYIETHF